MLFVRRRRKSAPISSAQRRQREAARAQINDRVAYWSAEMGIYPKRVAIRDQRSRWGSASTLGNLNFNWRITHMPSDVFDYVVIHELAHLREMNHSADFWSIVAAFSPDYQDHRRWLRKLGSTTRVSLR